MARMNRVWFPLLVGLLVAGLLGVGGGGAVAAEPRVTTASIMIPAAAFIPAEDGYDYTNNGMDLYVTSGYGVFTYALPFPVPVVNIKKITLYGYDNTGAADVCVTLYRARPVDFSEDNAGQVCTTVSATAPQAVYTTTIDPRRVTTASQGAYLWVSLNGPGVTLYGVKVNYSYTG
jgi:hypothetical protein